MIRQLFLCQILLKQFQMQGMKHMKIWKRQIQSMRKKIKNNRKLNPYGHDFLGSAIFTIPLFYIAMGHMVGLPLPEIIDPMVNPEWFSLIQLILTIPVMIYGLNFFTVGYKTLFRGHP